MQSTQSQSHHHASNKQVESHHESNYQLQQQVKKLNVDGNVQQTISTIIKKDSQQQQEIPNNTNTKCHLPECLKRQMLRLFFIPLLIVLFLLTIALTFKQNNYQTNDYFYSKNIQINRKIRGVVPPLNETKENIFGQYRIGLVQYFSVDDRRMLEGFRVEMWRNQSMRVSEINKIDKCWSVYKLKFYSSTIFIQRKQAHLMNITVKQNITNNQNKSTEDKSKRIQQGSEKDPQSIKSENQTESGKNVPQHVLPDAGGNSSQTQISQQSSAQSLQKKDSQQITTVQVQQPLCQLQKWSRLNQILSNSHIWTFAQGNFYLMEFSQIEEDNNGVLIMKMIDQYPSNI